MIPSLTINLMFVIYLMFSSIPLIEITKGYVKTIPEKSLDTMQDILDSNVPIYMYNSHSMEHGPNMDPVRQEILDRTITRNTDVKNVMETIYDIMENNGAVHEPVKERPPWPAHATKEVVTSNPNGYIMERGSILKPMFDW